MLTRSDEGLDILWVSPEFRRRGIGAALTRRGLLEVEGLGFDIFIHGKADGLPVYLKCGFQLVDQVTLSDAKYGGPGEYMAYALIRENKDSKRLGR